MSKQFIRPFFLVWLVLAVFTMGASAQTDCAKTLIDAENLYQSGQLYDIPEVLTECLEGGFNRQEKQSAYRLLTLTYLHIHQEEKAKETFHKLLRLNPDYRVVQGKDPIELYNLYLQFNVDPIYYVGLRAGGVATRPLILQQRSSSSLEGMRDKMYEPSFGFQLGAEFAMPLHKNLLLEISPVLMNSSYRFQSFYLTDAFDEHTEVPQVQEVNGQESYTHLMLPLSVHLRIPGKEGRLFYSIGAGAAASYLLASAYQNVSRENRQIHAEEIRMDRLETTPFRQRINVLTQVELGLEYKALGYFWGARAGVSSNLLDFSRYPDQQAMYLNSMSMSFGWIDDDFVLANGYFSFFIRKPIYKFL